MVLEVEINSESVKKLEKFLGTGKYKELAVSTQSFSRKLNEERKMRIPYVDSQVGHRSQGCSRQQRPKWVKSNERREEERKSVLTMASYTCERHHGWRTQTAWTKILLTFRI